MQHNVTLWRVRVTTAAMQTLQYVPFSLSFLEYMQLSKIWVFSVAMKLQQWVLHTHNFQESCLTSEIQCRIGLEPCSSFNARWTNVVHSSVTFLRLTWNKAFIKASKQFRGPGKRRRYTDSLRAGRSGNRIPVGARFSAPVQTGPVAHPASCTMGAR